MTRKGSKIIRTTGSKNNKLRRFNCGEALQNLLKSIKPVIYKPDDLVFLSPKNKAIRYNNFCKRAWDKIVDPIVNRPNTPYSCRDTFMTEQIAKGIPPAVVARWCDTSTSIIEKHYLDGQQLEHLKPIE